MAATTTPPAGNRDRPAPLAHAWESSPELDYFELFGLEAAFAIDTDRLTRVYREVQQAVHPDRYASAGAREQRASAAFAVRLNEAYKTLQVPSSRARYLLRLAGVESEESSAAARLPAEFLKAQFAWREEVSDAFDARDAARLGAVKARLAEEMRDREADLMASIDVDRNYAKASGLVAQFAFLTKVCADIDRLVDELDELGGVCVQVATSSTGRAP